MSLATRPRRRLDDLLNPILVKEVRQSLRGKYFRVLFWLTLGIGTLIGLGIISSSVAKSENAVELGQTFFMSIFAVLAAAVHGFVPLAAFLSTSGEWDENTHDLLIISNLKPRQIVLGKLLSALIQALLYYSTFGPFLVLAFLMNGVDLASVLVILAGSMSVCLGLTLVGIAAASLPANKIGRVLGLTLFGATLVMLWGTSLGLASGISHSPQILRTSEGRFAVLLFLSMVWLGGLLAWSVAISRFSHAEENRSTSLRIVSTFVVLLAGAWGAWGYDIGGGVQAVWGAQSAAAGLLFLGWLLFLSEPDALTRRVQRHLPRKRVLALLAAPFLPGGGRAVLLAGVQLALALALSYLTLLFKAPSMGAGTTPGVPAGFLPDEAASNQMVLMTLMVYGIVFAYAALPAGLAALMGRRKPGPILVRVLTFVAFPLSIVLPALAGLFLQDEAWMEFEHPFNPFWVVFEVERGNMSALVFFGPAMALALLLNLRRAFAGLAEVARARPHGPKTIRDAAAA